MSDPENIFHASEPLQWTVRDLRRRWKPIKNKLQEDPSKQPILTRVHRACSWIEQAEYLQQRLAEKAETLSDAHQPDGPDTILIYQWIAFQSLYGKWNFVNREPEMDRPSWMDFLHHLLRVDRDHRLGDALDAEKDRVLAIIGDAYLNKHYWSRPGERQAYEARRTADHAIVWFEKGLYPKLLHESVERVYLLRSQMVQGAATFGSRLNRDSLRQCIDYMNILLPAMLLVLIDHGYSQDWGPLCYPPQGDRD